MVSITDGIIETDLYMKPTDSYQYLLSSSCHPFYCKKGIPYSQALRLNRICSNNEFFDKRCNDLEKYLLERGYSEKMVRKEMLRARVIPRDALLEKFNNLQHNIPKLWSRFCALVLLWVRLVFVQCLSWKTPLGDCFWT